MRFTLLTTATLYLAAAGTERGPMAEPVAEIVTFRLAEGADPAAFAKAADGMTPYLQGTGAVLSRTLSVDEDGIWTDHITWTSLQAATSAAEKMMQAPQAMPFMQMIAADTVQMRHAPIRFTMKRE
jgi:hypothetical protein